MALTINYEKLFRQVLKEIRESDDGGDKVLNGSKLDGEDGDSYAGKGSVPVDGNKSNILKGAVGESENDMDNDDDDKKDEKSEEEFQTASDDTKIGTGSLPTDGNKARINKGAVGENGKGLVGSMGESEDDDDDDDDEDFMKEEDDVDQKDMDKDDDEKFEDESDGDDEKKDDKGAEKQEALRKGMLKARAAKKAGKGLPKGFHGKY